MKRIRIHMLEPNEVKLYGNKNWVTCTYGNSPERAEKIIEQMMELGRTDLYIES